MRLILAVSVVIIVLLWCLWSKKTRSWAIIGGIAMIGSVLCPLRAINSDNPEQFYSKDYLRYLEGRGLTVAQVIENEKAMTDIEQFCGGIFVFSLFSCLFIFPAVWDLEDKDKKIKNEILKKVAVFASAVFGLFLSLYIGIKFPLVPCVNDEKRMKRKVVCL